MLRRVLTAAVLIPIVVALIWWAPLLAVAAAGTVVLLLAMHEFFALGDRMGLRAYRSWTMLCTIALVYAQWMKGLEVRNAVGPGADLVRNAAAAFSSIEFVAIVFVFGAAMIAVFSRQGVAEIVPSIAVSSAALVFIALPFSYLIRILENADTGRQFVLFTLVLIWAGDMLAYFVGRTFGHSRMAPALSPKKTWEGAAANLAASLVVALFFARWIHTDGLTLLVVAALANVAGQLGDLLESAYKRGAGVKDSSGLLPGHGGMLDRIDSLILAAPVVWWGIVWMRSGFHF